MSYDHALPERIRRALAGRIGFTEKKMFGGLTFLLDGKMFCGIVQDDLMVRVGPDGHADALARRHVRPMDFTGRPMEGYVFVAPDGCKAVPSDRVPRSSIPRDAPAAQSVSAT